MKSTSVLECTCLHEGKSPVPYSGLCIGGIPWRSSKDPVLINHILQSYIFEFSEAPSLKPCLITYWLGAFEQISKLLPWACFPIISRAKKIPSWGQSLRLFLWKALNRQTRGKWYRYHYYWQGVLHASGFHGYNRPIKRVQWLKESRDSMLGVDLFTAEEHWSEWRQKQAVESDWLMDKAEEAL